MELREGYKQTEVGVIPEDWEPVQIGETGSVMTGSTPPTSDPTNYGSDFLFVSPFDLGAEKYIRRTEKMLSHKGFSTTRKFPSGSVLFVCIGSTIGKCGIASSKLTSNQQINAISPSSAFDSEFVFYAVSAIAHIIREQAGEQAVPIVNKSQFSQSKFPLPPTKAEQEAIAEALSDADALIESLEQLIAKKRQIKQGAMQELLTGKKRLPGFSDAWKPRRLGELGTTYGGLTGKTKADFGQGSARFITFLNVVSNTLIDCSIFEAVAVSPAESQNQVKNGDLLFNGSSETPEEVALCSLLNEEVEGVYLNSFCFGFRFREGTESNGLFIAYFLRSSVGRELMKSLAQGSTRYNLSKAALLDSLVVIPDQPEQTAIATILSDMDAEIVALETKLAKAREVKQGMMEELLTGNIRLVQTENSHA